MSKKRALVIGGSLAGLFAANLLRSIGWEVAVFERTKGGLTGRGAGIGTRPELFQIMENLGIKNAQDKGIRLDTRMCLNARGEVTHDIFMPQIMSSWATIYAELQRLVQETEYRDEKYLVGIEQSADSVTAVFADGSRYTGELLIGADGSRSTVRQIFAPLIQPVYSGYVAWRGMLDEEQFDPCLRAQILERYTYCFPDGEQFLGYPVPGRANHTVEGRRAYNFVWYRPTEAGTELRNLCTDANGKCWGESIAPPLIRDDILQGLKDAAEQVLAPQLAQLVKSINRPFFHPIYDLKSEDLVFGRTVLIGDAAFVARPHVGAGITKAAMDAECLASELSKRPDDLPMALRRFELQTLEFGGAVVDRSRYLGAYLEAQLKPREMRKEHERVRDIRQTMLEHGAALTDTSRQVLAEA